MNWRTWLTGEDSPATVARVARVAVAKGAESYPSLEETVAKVARVARVEAAKTLVSGSLTMKQKGILRAYLELEKEWDEDDASEVIDALHAGADGLDEWLQPAQELHERREKIRKHYISEVCPLDNPWLDLPDMPANPRPPVIVQAIRKSADSVGVATATVATFATDEARAERNGRVYGL